MCFCCVLVKLKTMARTKAQSYIPTTRKLPSNIPPPPSPPPAQPSSSDDEAVTVIDYDSDGNKTVTKRSTNPKKNKKDKPKEKKENKKEKLSQFLATRRDLRLA